MEDEEYKKLPIEERCVHKLWKARVNGYEEVTKLFRRIDDEKSPEFAKYLGLVKKFVVDSNAMGQEKGLEATLAYVENYATAGKTVGEVMSGIVNKCIAAPKTKTRDLALQVTLMYIEIEKQDAVLEELMKGMDVKNPKIVAACINATTTGLREFGSKVINVKPLVKKIPILFADRDKNVRDEAKALVVEMFRWIRDALRPQLANLQPVQITELETEFAKIDGRKATPTRYLKSQQEKQAKLAAEADSGEEVEDEDEADEPAVVDLHDIADPVDILSKLPKDFFTKLEAKQWQERKEALECLENLVKAPKLEAGDYADIVRALIKIVQKDSNVVVVALAAKCLGGLASGLRKRFQPYTSAVIPILLEKFKEKKQSVVAAVRDAIDMSYVATIIENVLEDVLEALNNKNPSVKSETALFLARAFTRTAPTALNKKLLKALTGGLIKIINEPDPTVRDSAAEALGTLMKLVGEKAVAPFLTELEKDALKMAKIREFCEKAAIRVPGRKKERPTTCPAKSAPKLEPAKQPPSSAPKSVKRPGTGVKKKPLNEISSGTATIVKSKSGKNIKSAAKAVERELSDEEVSEVISDILSADIINGLADANWKNRLSAIEQFVSIVQGMDGASMPTQALVKVLCKKPGLKDTNFQVLKGRLDAIKHIAANGNFSITTATFCVNDITEKLGDTKNGGTAGEALTAIAEATSLSHVSNGVIEFAFTQKSPKVLQEALSWMSIAIKEFGFANLNAKFLIENAKKGLASNNASVRSAAIVFFGVLYLYMGPTLHTFLENEKPALRELINAEFDKYENDKPPAPIRGIKKSASSNELDADDDDADVDAGGDGQVVNIQDLIPRSDISPQITEALINELTDRNWKVRNEALLKVSAIISEAKLIKPSVGDLPQVLASRLVDSNSKIAQTTFTICESLATAMGPSSKQYIRVFFPGCLQGLGDSKAWIRTAALGCMNTFGDLCSYKDFFEGEMIGDALKTGSPTLRCELWGWLGEKLPKIKSVPKEELMICIPYLYSNLEDRSAEVRKNANEAVLGVMIHVGYESMVKQLEKLKPGSKQVVVAALDKARPNLPAKPAPIKKQLTQDAKEEKVVRRPQSTPTKTATKSKQSIISKPVARSKKEEDIDTSPLLVVNNMKHQRTIDESKLKVLKWNFTTPREEFVELLRDQMANANVNKTLTANMFHTDFRNHIKAIEALTEDLPDNHHALISNLDLILKWLTLRFFDTNPSVLLKGLEYLQSVFGMLNENNYHMLENEASSFIPYLILKIGDPKDSVRNGVRALLKLMTYIYSVSKLFSYIMEGLKSKNARQRAECLEVMGSIIAKFGINVCLPSPAACLKEIAKQISDRDNAVRNAALNCVVQAYYLVGEKVYKMVGQISDKDMSLLEERIKRASKKPPAQNTQKIDLTQPMNTTIQKSPSSDPHYPMQNQCDDDDDVDDEAVDIEEEDNLPEAALPPQVKQEPEPQITGPFNLDDHLVGDLDNMKTLISQPRLNKFDMAFLDEKVSLPTAKDARAKIIPMSPPRPVLGTDTFLRQGMAKSTSELQLEKNIIQLASIVTPTALQAMGELLEVLKSNKATIMMEYEEKFMSSVVTQLKHLSQQDTKANENVLITYTHLFAVFDSFYENNYLGRKVSFRIVKDLLNHFIEMLVYGKFEGVQNGAHYIRLANMNCVNIIERSNHTTVLCALVQLLHNCLKVSGPLRLTDLLMKCLWRVIKSMPAWTDNDIDYDSVLLDVHLFLKDFPTAWWKNKQADTPLRTIKTILHSMAKRKGGDLMLHLTKVPNTNDSEMEAYIMKLLKNLKLEQVKQVPLKTDSRRSLSRSTHSQLTDIFQKIGNKEETKEGLNLLYDFLQQNPDADVEPFLKRSSQFFQEYIQKNLKQIELERNSTSNSHKNVENIEHLNHDSSSDKDIAYYEKRIKMWKEHFGLETSDSADNCEASNKDIDYYEDRLKMWKGYFEKTQFN